MLRQYVYAGRRCGVRARPKKEGESSMRRMQGFGVITQMFAHLVSLAGLALALLLVFSVSALADDVTREMETGRPVQFRWRCPRAATGQWRLQTSNYSSRAKAPTRLENADCRNSGGDGSDRRSVGADAGANAKLPRSKFCRYLRSRAVRCPLATGYQR